MRGFITDENFATVVDHVKNYAIFLLDANTVISTWNRGAKGITGWSRSDVVGKQFSFLYTDQDIKNGIPEQNLSDAIKHGNYNIQALRSKKDGTKLLADISITAIQNKKTGKNSGFLVIAKDITESRRIEKQQVDINVLLNKEIERRKKIEEELNHSNQELDQFASVASHDLQEPLRMVVSYLQLIERRYKDKLDQDGREFLAFAVDGGTRMKFLLSDLVQYARINTLSKPFVKTDSEESLNRAIDNVRVAIDEAKAKVTHDSLPIIYSDRVQLTQLFQNLLANAITYRSKRPLKIHVSAKKQSDEWVFSITDNGIGIEKKYLNAIFLVFKRVAKRTDKKGTGMGLAISKKIVVRHGGRIWAESILRHGTAIFFTFPIAARKEETHE